MSGSEERLIGVNSLPGQVGQRNPNFHRHLPLFKKHYLSLADSWSRQIHHKATFGGCFSFFCSHHFCNGKCTSCINKSINCFPSADLAEPSYFSSCRKMTVPWEKHTNPDAKMDHNSHAEDMLLTTEKTSNNYSNIQMRKLHLGRKAVAAHSFLFIYFLMQGSFPQV